jgi:hypothetical protein
MGQNPGRMGDSGKRKIRGSGGDGTPSFQFPSSTCTNPTELSSFAPFQSIMPVVTRESNANAHPGRVVQKGQRKKRTKEEIAADKAKAQANSVAAKQEAARKHQDMIANIAGLKASVVREEEEIRAHAKRPDLQYSPPGVTRTALARGLQAPVQARECTDIMHDLDSVG